jgi:DNA-binding response OmpR family regulator
MKKVLIIEDQMDIALLEKDYLEINGIEADIETDGIKGLERFKSNKYDLVILDIMLGHTDGYSIIKEIRLISLVPVIFVSAKNEEIDKIRGLGLGSDDYITKPFSPSELVARVKAHINRFESLTNTKSPNKDIIIAHIIIEPQSRKVFKNSLLLNLTSREFELLSFLAQNPNIVFSKEQLFDKLWDFDSYGDISTVAVHIKRVREKIEINPEKPTLIETVWGSGYRLNL